MTKLTFFESFLAMHVVSMCPCGVKNGWAAGFFQLRKAQPGACVGFAMGSIDGKFVGVATYASAWMES